MNARCVAVNVYTGRQEWYSRAVLIIVIVFYPVANSPNPTAILSSTATGSALVTGRGCGIRVHMS